MNSPIKVEIYLLLDTNAWTLLKGYAVTMYEKNTNSIMESKIGSTPNLVLELLIWGLVLAFITLQLYRPEIINKNENFFVLTTNFFIICLSIIFMIFGDPYPFSLNKIFMLFSLFFFGIAPAIQYQQGITFWDANPFSNFEFLQTNVIILFILIYYQATYFLITRLKSDVWRVRLFGSHKGRLKLSLLMMLLVAIISTVITFHVKEYNFNKLIFRFLGGTNLAQSQTLVYEVFVRPLPAIVLILFKQSGKRNTLVEIFLWTTVLISNFPTNTPRYYAAAIYLPLLVVYFKSFFSSHYLLLNKTVVIGLLVMFPFLNQFRGISSLTEISFFIDTGMFAQGHFDSYQMLMKVISEDIVTLGNQILGVLFFFVPRSIWNSKPIGSGHFISEHFGYSYSNISMNFFGEGYINFGYLGIVVFVVFIAYINSTLDKEFWKKGQFNPIFSSFYLIFLFMEFFILRGDLLSSYAYTIGLLCSLIFVVKISSFAIFSS